MAREGDVGKPILGASVFVDGVTRAIGRTQSDGEGLFQLRVDLSSLKALRVEAPGFVGEEVKGETLIRRNHSRQQEPGGDGRIPFYLTPGVEVDGRVLAKHRIGAYLVPVDKYLEARDEGIGQLATFNSDGA